jgi:pSer/pThr/pTyr-binding forkhead associated (FHA) protein
VRFEGDLQISKEHLRISVEGSTVKVTDLGSANGTFVDEQRLAANETVPVGEGQVVRLGKHTKLRIGLRYS